MASNSMTRANPRVLHATPQRRDETDLRTVVGVLSDHKWLILIGTGLFFVASALYVLLATPVYQASAVVQVQRAPATVPGVGGEQGTQAMAVPESRSATEIPLLTSRQILGETVRELGMDTEIRPARFPLIGEYVARANEDENPDRPAKPWLGLSGFGWGGESLRFERLDVPVELIGQELELVADKGGSYSLRADGRTLVEGRVGQTLKGDGVTVEVAELQANPGTRFEVKRFDTLAVIDKLREDIEVSEQGRDSGVISIAYAHADPAVAKRVVEKLTTNYVRQNQTRMSAEAASRLAFVREQLPKVEKQLEQAQAALTAFQTQSGTLDVTAQNQSLLSQAMALESNISQLKVQQAEVAGRYTPRHPQYRAIAAQIGSFQAQKAAIEQRINNLPDTQRQLFRLTRDVEVTNRTYANLLDQEQQLDIAQASAVGTAHIVDPADVRTDQPSNPRPLPVMAGGTALGALLMVGFVLGRHTLRRAVEDPDDIELIGVPVFASIPYSAKARVAMARPRGQANLLALSAPHDLAMEALRGLRTNLLLARMKGESNLLMVAAPSPGVGKTFVCSNLAVSIAQTGQRVLLIDADMRRGTLHESLGTGHENGLSEVLAGTLPLEAALRTVAGVENLTFLSRGDIPPNPSELLMSPMFEKLLEEVAPRFDIVLIDTPPVLAVTDATVIGHHVGTSLMVARYGLSEQREVALAVQRLEQNGIEVAGAIFNAVENRMATRYAYTQYPAPAKGGKGGPRRLRGPSTARGAASNRRTTLH